MVVVVPEGAFTPPLDPAPDYFNEEVKDNEKTDALCALWANREEMEYFG